MLPQGSSDMKDKSIKENNNKILIIEINNELFKAEF